MADNKNFAERTKEEAYNLLSTLLKDTSVKHVTSEGFLKFLYSYTCLKVKWEVQLFCIRVLEVLTLITLYKTEFTFATPSLFRYVLMLNAVIFFSYVLKLDDERRNKDVVKSVVELVRKYPEYYIFEEEPTDGGDSEQLQGSGTQEDS